MAPGTEFARDFCAAIGPLKLGVVLVHLLIHSLTNLTHPLTHSDTHSHINSDTLLQIH